MKQYKTKTGVVLTVIQGGGEGDGRPCGSLRVVRPDEHTLVDGLEGALISISRPANYASPYLDVTIKIPRVAFKPKALGGMVFDINDALGRRYAMAFYNPSVGGIRERSKKGFKILTFSYELTDEKAQRLGFTDKFGETYFLQKSS